MTPNILLFIVMQFGTMLAFYQSIMNLYTMSLYSCNVLLRIIQMTALLTGGTGDAFCPSSKAPVGWRLLSAPAPLSVPCQN